MYWSNWWRRRRLAFIRLFLRQISLVLSFLIFLYHFQKLLVIESLWNQALMETFFEISNFDKLIDFLSSERLLFIRTKLLTQSHLLFRSRWQEEFCSFKDVAYCFQNSIGFPAPIRENNLTICFLVVDFDKATASVMLNRKEHELILDLFDEF